MSAEIKDMSVDSCVDYVHKNFTKATGDIAVVRADLAQSIGAKNLGQLVFLLHAPRNYVSVFGIHSKEREDTLDLIERTDWAFLADHDSAWREDGIGAGLRQAKRMLMDKNPAGGRVQITNIELQYMDGHPGLMESLLGREASSIQLQN